MKAVNAFALTMEGDQNAGARVTGCNRMQLAREAPGSGKPDRHNSALSPPPDGVKALSHSVQGSDVSPAHNGAQNTVVRVATVTDLSTRKEKTPVCVIREHKDNLRPGRRVKPAAFFF